jgi:hypothetical protein
MERPYALPLSARRAVPVLFATFATLGTVAALALAPLACGGSKPEPTQTAPQGSWSAAPPNAWNAPPPASAPPAGTAPMATAPATAPAPTGPAPTATAPTASAMPAVPDAVVTALLAPLAAKYAPGMQPEGAPLSANLAEGGSTEMIVSMSGGKCYTIVGASPLGVGVKDLNIKLLTPPFYTLSAGQDSTTSNEAVIGGGKAPTCPLLPVPIAYKLTVTAAKGAGPVGVQVYSKTK